MTIWRLRIEFWILKAANTALEYVILIAFPLQQLLHKCASMLRYTRIACVVCCHIISTGLRLFDGNLKMFPAILLTL
jgi:hypothetical protein